VLTFSYIMQLAHLLGIFEILLGVFTIIMMQFAIVFVLLYYFKHKSL